MSGTPNLYLAGLSGTGKSTVAALAGRWLGARAEDVDHEVERAAPDGGEPGGGVLGDLDVVPGLAQHVLAQLADAALVVDHQDRALGLARAHCSLGITPEAKSWPVLLSATPGW